MINASYVKVTDIFCLLAAIVTEPNLATIKLNFTKLKGIHIVPLLLSITASILPVRNDLGIDRC